MKTLAIIGFGRFGQLAAKFLRKDFEVFVADKLNRKKEADKLKVKFVTLKEAASKDIIVLAVPISETKNVLLKIKKHLKKGSLVIDTCSVKEYPIALMKKILSKNIEIIGTHPMFGPDSVKDSLRNKKIVLCPVRSKRFNKIKNILRSKGLDVIVRSPAQHDKQIAKTLCFVHFIGRSLEDMKIKEEKIDTLGYKRLLKILETVSNDTLQLFYDMHHYNKYSKEVRKKFIQSLRKIDKNLK